MSLPIRTFFSLYQEGIKREATQYRELLRIQAVSGIVSMDYYRSMDDFYRGIMDPRVKELPPLPPGPSLDLASKEAKNVLIDIFAKVKRQMGYRPREMRNG